MTLVLGFAQLAAKSARAKQATSAGKKGLRTVMIKLLQIGAGPGTEYRRLSYSRGGGIFLRIFTRGKFCDFRRCRPDLNRGMKVLQTFALPLGHGTGLLDAP